MKIQLLQDIDDSGAAQPPRRPPASPWHRAPATPAGGRDAPARAQVEGQPQPSRAAQAQAQPTVPQTAPQTERHASTHSSTQSATQTPAQARTEAETTAAPFTTATPEPYFASEPDWLVELMRQDAERADAQQRAGQWRRRVFTWAIAAGALAALAAGGFWLVEDLRVDGALVVVAETSPSPAAPAAPGSAAKAETPAPALAARGTAAKAAPPSAATPESIAPTVERRPALPMLTRPPPEVASPVDARAAGSSVQGPGRERKPNAARAEAKRAADRESSERHGREETLLQCRALGYDEAQCVKRGCVMTRFGLACRG